MNNYYTHKYISLLGILVCSSSQAFAIEAPHLREIKKDSCLVHLLADQIKDQYHQFFKESYYDRSVYDLEAGLDSKPQFNSLQIFDQYGTANCVGISQYFVREFASFATLHVIPGILPEYYQEQGGPLYQHAVAIAACQDGLVLLDPTMNLPEPIVLIPGQPTKIRAGAGETVQITAIPEQKKIQINVDSDDPIHHPWSEEKRRNRSSSYDLMEITNPDAAISDPLYQLGNKILVFGYSPPEDPFYALIYRLKDQQLEFSKYDSSGADPRILTLPFGEYEKDPEAFIQKVLTAPDLVTRMKMPPDVLRKRVNGTMKLIFKRKTPTG